MKKHIILCAVAAAILCATMVLSSFAAVNKADEWDNLYYEPTVQKSARGISTDLKVADKGNILNGKSVSFSQVVQLHLLSYYTIDEETIEAFASAINGGMRMADMLEATDTYMVQNGSDTLILTSNGEFYEVQAVIEKDSGSTFSIDETAKNQLDKNGMTPKESTSVQCVGVPAVGTAVFFSEGDAEYITFTVSRCPDLVIPDRVYTVKELASIMVRNKSTFALPPLDLSGMSATEID